MKHQRSLVIVSKALAPYRVRFYSEVAKSLAPYGWKVTLVVAMLGAKDHPWSNPGIDCEALEVRCANEGEDRSIIHRACGGLGLTFGIKDIEIPNLNLITILNELSPEVVWTHEYSPFCLAAALWSSLRERNSIMSSELGDSPPAYAASRTQLQFQKSCSFLYQGVIAQTLEATRRSFPRDVPQVFAPHAIDTCEYFPLPISEERPFRFLFTGALCTRKGLDSLIEAGRMLCEEGAVFELRIVGTGPLAQWLSQQSDPWLSISGFREGQDLIGEYQSAHAYVLPTRGDTYAVTVHEAAASGLALIIGRNAGASETLVEEGVSGYAIDPEDVRTLAIRMKKLLDNPQAARTMGMHARKLAEGLDVKLLGVNVANFIREFPRLSR